MRRMDEDWSRLTPSGDNSAPGAPRTLFASGKHAAPVIHFEHGGPATRLQHYITRGTAWGCNVST
jgi:hypothetical protein